MTDPNLYLASLNTTNLFLMSGLLDNQSAAAAAASASPVTTNVFNSPAAAAGLSSGGTPFSLTDALKFPSNGTSTPVVTDFSNALSTFGSSLSGRVATPTNDLSQNLGLSLANYSFANTLNDASSMGNSILTSQTTNNNLTNFVTGSLSGKDSFGPSSLKCSSMDLLGPDVISGDGGVVKLPNGILPQPLPNESSTNLITNYLPPSMKQEEVRALFSSIGDVESCKLVRDKITGQSLCYAFVNFKESRDASVAVDRLNGILVGNKKIKVSFARPSSPSIKDANLYISGIPKDVTASDLEKLFSEVGSIITSRILADPTTGQSRGVGFIRFDHRRDAERAIQRFDGYQFPAGRNGGSPVTVEKLTVKFANTPSHHSQKALQQAYLTASQRRLAASPLAFATPSGPSIHPPIKSFRFSPLSTSSPIGSAASTADFSSALAGLPALSALSASGTAAAAASALSAAGCLANTTTGPGYCLFVYNLASDCEEKEIWQLFGPLGAVKSVKLVYDENKKCKGFGFVTMAHYDESLHAINTLNGAPYNNRILQVSFKSAVSSASKRS